MRPGQIMMGLVTAITFAVVLTILHVIWKAIRRRARPWMEKRHSDRKREAAEWYAKDRAEYQKMMEEDRKP